MEKVCKNCHWYKPKREHANIINCLEHFDFHEENDTCESFCEDGKYVPTGIWADLAKVVEAVSDEVKRRESKN